MLNNFDAVLNTAGEKEPILLENLLFSLNMSLPLFIVMGLGCILTHKGFFTENYIAHTTNLVYYVLLPGKMFLDIATSDLSTAFDIRYVAVATGGVVLQFALAWAAGWLLCPDRSKQSAFSHAAYRGNFVYLGTALLRNIYGVSHVPSATLILALVIPLYNIQGVVLMTVKERQGRFRLSTVLLNVLKNPMILAVLAAIPFAYFKIQLPFVVSESLGYFQAATNTMALLVVGFIFLGRNFAFSTVYCSVVLSLAVNVMERFWPLDHPLTNQPLLELCFAVLLPAIGSAILFHLDASSGGTDIVAMIVRKYTSLNIGMALMVADALITVAALFCFGIQSGLFCILGLLMKSVLVDYVTDSFRMKKCFQIITTNPEPIVDFITVNLHRGATLEDVYGAFHHERKTMIITVLTRAQALALRRFIHMNDPHAFMVITASTEIVGKGFLAS